jgi:hypothetical protein
VRRLPCVMVTAAMIGAAAVLPPSDAQAWSSFARAYAAINPRDDAPHEFGCRRILRCSREGCGWRRGCWGIYGYRESPYYYGLAGRHERMHWEGAISARISRRALRERFPPLDPRRR